MEVMGVLSRFVLVVIGVTYLSAQSALFRPVRIRLLRGLPKLLRRLLGTLLYCWMCSAFWIGLIAGQLGLYLPGTWPLEAAVAALGAVAIVRMLATDGSDAFLLELPLWDPAWAQELTEEAP